MTSWRSGLLPMLTGKAYVLPGHGSAGLFGQVDLVLILCGLVLYAAGLDALAATSEHVAGIPLIYRQLAWGAVAMLAALACCSLPTRLYRLMGWPAWVLTVILLAAVLTQRPINGARAWFRLGPISFQASELAKLSVPLALAAWLSRRRPTTVRRAAIAAATALVPVALITVEPDIGNAAVLTPSWLAAIFAARPRWHVAALHVALMLAVPAALVPFLTSEQRARLVVFATQSDFDQKPSDEAYQLFQARRVVMLAGTFGSDEACAVHVPMAYNDFVFSKVIARRGLAGAGLVLACYALLVWRFTVMASAARRPFTAYFITATAAWFATQTCINLAMTVGLAPITGITLPFVSYGGTSLVVSCTSLAVSWRLYKDDMATAPTL